MNKGNKNNERIKRNNFHEYICPECWERIERCKCIEKPWYLIS